VQPTEPDTRTYHFDIFADYHLVWLEDCGVKDAISAGLFQDPAETPQQFAARMQRLDQDAARIASLVTPETIARGLGVAYGTLCIFTARNLDVPVTVQMRDSPSRDDFAQWDRVVEASLEVPSGSITVHNPSDDVPEEPRIAVTPGTYRARVFYGGLATVSADELEGEDHYRIELWPQLGPSAAPVVLHVRASGV
jgi:hypothetical protein